MRNTHVVHRFRPVRCLVAVLWVVGVVSLLGLQGFARTAATDPPVRRCTITLTSTEGGVANGGGDYASETAVTLTAEAMNGYVFDGWYESDKRVYNFNVYTFLITNNRSLEARFSPVSAASSVRPTPQVLSQASQSSQADSPSQAETSSPQEASQPAKEETSATETSASTPEPEPVAEESSQEAGDAQALPEETAPEPDTAVAATTSDLLPQTGKGVQGFLPLGAVLLLAGLLFGRRRES